MDAVKIKICGLMRPEDIDAVNEYRPDLAGFILARGRRRSLTDQQMRELVRALRPEIQSAAVFLDHGAGTGAAFDWSLIRQIHRPYILAGGLDPENVRAALEQMHPYAVDVSSGVETAHCKDPEKIRRFIRAVRETAR